MAALVAICLQLPQPARKLNQCSQSHCHAAEVWPHCLRYALTCYRSRTALIPSSGAANIAQVLLNIILNPEAIEADLKDEAMQRDFLNVDSMMSIEVGWAPVGCQHTGLSATRGET